MPLDEEKVRFAVKRFKDHDIKAIAICTLFSFKNNKHELRISEIVKEMYPEARIFLSHEVMPAAPEFERTSTTMVASYIGPRVVDYLHRLVKGMQARGFTKNVLVTQSNGGITSIEAASQKPIVTLASGPVGGVNASVAICRDLGVKNFISCDMGGTSYDVSLVYQGRPEVKSTWNWVARYCISLPMVDVLSIGAGGGSIANVQSGGLNVGPDSAGSKPGPICYGKGGERVTVTDANLLLGYLNPESLCGGQMKIDASNVEKAIKEQIADPLGLSVIEAAAGIHRLTLSNMNNAIRRVSCEKGHDPRYFDLVAFGGNGGMHATGQALEMGIERVIVPRLSPVFCAYGALCADFVVDGIQAMISDTRKLDHKAFAAAFAKLTNSANDELGGMGVGIKDIAHEYTVACRYNGQTAEISVPITLNKDGGISDDDLKVIETEFHKRHKELHTFNTPDEPVIIAELRLRSTGATPTPELKLAAKGVSDIKDALKTTRQAYFGGKMIEANVYDGPKLGPDTVLAGPAIIEETFTTVILHPGQQTKLDKYGNHVITKVEA